MGDLLRDLKYTARLLLKRPGFTAVAVLSLALGIGANTTIFSLVNELFLSPLPIEEPSEVVAVFTVDERIPGLNQLSHLNWRDLREQNAVFEDVAGYAFGTVALSYAGSDPGFAFAQTASGNFFDVLGVRAAHGRTFLPSEDTPGGSPVAVIGWRYFQESLGGDPSVVGEEISVNGQAFTLVGVAPPGFTGVNIGVEPAIWVPFGMNRVVQPDPALNWFDTRRGLFVFSFGRLRDGVDLEEAQANLAVLSSRLEEEYPDDNQGRSFEAVPIAEATIIPQARGGLLAGTGMLMATVGLVLLIACVNVANLLLARASERRREIALRLSLGVSRARLVRQLLTESVVVAVLGGIVGIVVALVARRLILAALPALPFGGALSLELPLDPRVLLFTLVLAVLTGLLFGLVPAIQSSRPELVGALKDQGSLEGARRLNLRNGLVVAQLALSLVALLAAGLFLRSLWAAQQIELGFDSDRLLALSYDVGMAGYERARGEAFAEEVVERIGSLPGVRSTAVAQAGPLQGTISRSVILPDSDSDQERTFVQVNVVGPGYFETMGIPVVRGRSFSRVDRTDSQPVIIVNETMAERFWPDREAVGQQFSFFGMEPVQVVGVARDVKYNNPGEDPQPYAYQPFGQQYTTTMTLIARVEGDPSGTLVAAERELRSMDPLLPIIGVSTVPQLVSNALFAPRFAAVFLGVLGVLALVLAAIGIYGVMSFAVSRRAREIGVRVALGADRSAVLGLVLRQGLALTVVGLAAGLVAAFLLTSLLRSLLFVSPTDPATFAAVSVLLLLVATLAVLVPAIRATRVDPIRVLRAD